MTKICKIDFFKAYREGEYAAHKKIGGKKHSLDKELYCLKKLINQETVAKDGRRLYSLAIQIFSRHTTPTFCKKMIAIFKNALCGRGFKTAAMLYNDILLLGKKTKFNAYEFSQEAIGPRRHRLAPKRLSFPSTSDKKYEL